MTRTPVPFIVVETTVHTRLPPALATIPLETHPISARKTFATPALVLEKLCTLGERLNTGGKQSISNHVTTFLNLVRLQEIGSSGSNRTFVQRQQVPCSVYCLGQTSTQSAGNDALLADTCGQIRTKMV